MAASFFFKSMLEEAPFVVFGTYFSWLYLRFWQQRPENNLKCVEITPWNYRDLVCHSPI